jgi:hypothetical protein
MSILSAVSHSSAGVQPGIRAVISGSEKIGKTTILSSAPRPLLIPLEAGYSGVKINMTPMLHDFNHVLNVLDEVIEKVKSGQFAYKTIAIDSGTALERLIHQKVLERDPLYAPGNKKTVTMDSALGGFGKGYNFSNELFGDFLKKCDALALFGGINIIITCHVFAAEVVDPTAGTYNTWDLLLHSPKNQKTYGKREMLTQWADLVGFLHEPIFVSEGKTMNTAVSQNTGRVLAVTRAPGYVAGNRFNVVSQIKLPRENGWNFLADEIFKCSGRDYYNRDV